MTGLASSWSCKQWSFQSTMDNRTELVVSDNLLDWEHKRLKHFVIITILVLLCVTSSKHLTSHIPLSTPHPQIKHVCFFNAKIENFFPVWPFCNNTANMKLFQRLEVVVWFWQALFHFQETSSDTCVLLFHQKIFYQA